MRVLVVKISSLGDVIHTLPALTDAAKAIPGIKFDWVVEESFAEIPAWHPAVDRVIPVAIRRWRKNIWHTWRQGDWGKFVKQIHGRPYDLVIDAQGLLKSAMIAKQLKNVKKVGLDRLSAREPVASRFYDKQVRVAWSLHAVERVRALFAETLGYRVPNAIGDYGIDADSFGVGGDVENYVVFLHGTTWKTKHWPELYWVELAELVNQRGLKVRLMWGNEEEENRAQYIASMVDNVTVQPKLDLAGVSQQIAGAKAIVSVDTGLGHLAAALNKPTVSIYGATNPGRTGVYGSGQVHLESELGCSPCLQKKCSNKTDRFESSVQGNSFSVIPPCFASVSPERVDQALGELLQGQLLVGNQLVERDA